MKKYYATLGKLVLTATRPNQVGLYAFDSQLRGPFEKESEAISYCEDAFTRANSLTSYNYHIFSIEEKSIVKCTVEIKRATETELV